MKKINTVIILFFITVYSSSQAQVRLPKVIGNNMVLQRDKPLPIWGWAASGEQVTVSFGGQKRTTIADETGSWKIVLSPLKACRKPGVMTIAASNTIQLTNILVGEVWLCSGQSNMEYGMQRGSRAKPLKGIDSTELALQESYPEIRIFLVQKVLSKPDVTSTGWSEASGESLKKFSAVGFYFAQKIQGEINVPIGVISSSWGGSRIEQWTPVEAYQSLPAFAAETAKNIFMIDSVKPGKIYESMIFPLSPFALRGFLWYQGESNCIIHDGLRYADKMQALVEGWRNLWGSNKLPFYSVLIAPCYYTKRKDPLIHSPETLPEFWEAQIQSSYIPNTAVTAISDLVDDLEDIHPSYKWEVGRRLALLALRNTYKRKIVSTGPLLKRVKFEKNKAKLFFENEKGLQSADGKPLTWFTIADKEGAFIPATAEIKNNKIFLSAVGINKPKAVRFGWHETAMPNLINAAGLPAFPFRTKGLKWNYKK